MKKLTNPIWHYIIGFLILISVLGIIQGAYQSYENFVREKPHICYVVEVPQVNGREVPCGSK